MSRRLSALAQLIDIHMKNGMLKTHALAEQTGYTDRAIRKAKVELQGGTIVPEPEFRAEPQFRNPSSGLGTLVPESGTPVPPSCVGAPASITSHANNESPTEILSLEVVEGLPLPENACREIEGLNGKTSTFVAWVAKGFNEHNPDYEYAYQMLDVNVEQYGVDQVLQGVNELKAKQAAGERVSFSRLPQFIKHAKTQVKQGESKFKSKYAEAEERNAAMLASIAEL